MIHVLINSKFYLKSERNNKILTLIATRTKTSIDTGKRIARKKDRERQRVWERERESVGRANATSKRTYHALSKKKIKSSITKCKHDT